MHSRKSLESYSSPGPQISHRHKASVSAFPPLSPPDIIPSSLSSLSQPSRPPAGCGKSLSVRDFHFQYSSSQAHLQ